MKSLSNTWFAEGYIDFEMKKYTLLAYLKEIHEHFSQTKLYPQLSDIILHYNNLLQFKHNKKLLQQSFPKKMTGLQLQKLTALYEALVTDNEMMEELEAIIQYADRAMKKTIEEGTEIYEWVEKNLNIETIGIVPLVKEEGYFLLTQQNEMKAYQYKINRIEKYNEKYKSMTTQYIDSWQKTFTHTYNWVKSNLISTKKELPNPAFYVVECEMPIPFEETLLPIAKRCLVRRISID